MAVNRFYSNNAVETTLTEAINSGATTMKVGSNSGFPTQYPFTLVLDEGTASREVVNVTAAAGLTLTIERGQDGTSAVGHDIGASVVHAHTARDFREPQEHMDAVSNVHGVGSGNSVVGTGTAQTLTNKNLTSSTNTFPSSLLTTTGSQTVQNKTFDSSNTFPSNIAYQPGDLKMVAYNVTGGGVLIDDGWLKCDGSAVSRDTYAALFAKIGTAYGAGDGNTTFNLPDLRGRVPLGAGTFAALANNEGKAEANRSVAHVHSISNSGTHSHSISSANLGGDDTMQGGGSQGRLFNSPQNKNHDHGGSTGNGGNHNHGGSTGNSVSDPISYLAINFLIKV